MSERKRKRREWLDAKDAADAKASPTPRPNPFLCSACGEAAIWRHYSPSESETPGKHVASFCAEHSPMYTDTLIV